MPCNVSRRTLPLTVNGFCESFFTAGLLIWAFLALKSSGIVQFGTLPFLLAAFGCLVFPVLILTAFSGFLADRLPKRYIVIAAKILQFPLLFAGSEAMANISSPAAGYVVLAVIFAVSVINAFNTPAREAILPETFGEPELSRACSRVTTASSLGAAMGILLLPCAYYSGGAFPVLLIAALVNFFAAVKIVPVISPVQKKRELACKFKEVIPLGFKALCRRAGLWSSALGEVCFTGLSLTALPLLILFCKYALQMDNHISIIVMLTAPGAGFVAGSLAAGMISRNKIELGLIPLGSLGMSVFLLLMLLFPGGEKLLSINFPGGTALMLNFHAGAWIFAAGAGFSGGILFIPLKSYLLQRLRPELRGAAGAIKNAVTFAVSFIAVTLIVVLSPDNNSSPLHRIADVPYQFLLGGFGIVVLLFSALALWALPNFMLRFVILTVGHLFYRVRISGAENIPERGPALLLCNHVSAIDSILVSACTSRQIRFLLYDQYFSLPLLGFIARMTGFFKVPSGRKAKSLAVVLQNIRSHLAGGGLVCVFPEGRLTRNGLVGKFKQGYEKMLPEDMDIPIIPVNISFAWGSIFSNFFTRPGIRKKVKLPFFPAVTFGEAMPKGSSTFEIRQKIIELGADAANHTFHGEMTLHHAAVKNAKRNWRKPKFRNCGSGGISTFKLVLEAALLSRQIRRQCRSEDKYAGILLPNGTDAVKAILAIQMADKIPVPLNYSTSQEVFDHSLKLAGITLVITGRTFREKLRFSPGNTAVDIELLTARSPWWRRWLMALGMVLLPSEEFMNMLSPLSAFELNNDGILLFSSGSTGNPKGVRLSHHNLNTNARSVASAFAADESDLIVGNLPLFHSFGLNVCCWMPLMYGIPVSYTASPLDGAAVRQIIRQEKATMLFATPTFLQKYLQKCAAGDLDSLRLIATGAEKLREDIAAKVRELTGDRLEVVECYGCTELSPVVSVNLAADIAETGRKNGCRNSIGQPLENVSVRILDPLSFTPVLPGEEGIICVKGSLVMQGYLNDDNATGKVMAGEYYKTGDIARMDKDGFIHICGRLSRFSKIAGEMVPHEMVEKIINEMCACENRAAAVGSIPDPVKGEALIVLYTAEMPFTPEEIVEQLREQSISNLWIPKVKNFHPVDKLPLLGSGKLDLAGLRAMIDRLSVSN